MTSAAGDEETTSATPRVRGRKKWLWIGAAAVAVPVVIIGAWVVWSLVRPNPEGFAPSVRASDPNAVTPDPVATAENETPAAPTPSPSAPALLQFTIDARSRQDWVFFNFTTGTTVDTTREALDWDLAFRRNDLLTNGGETNPAGSGGAVDLGEVGFDTAAVPADGFATDAEHEDRGLENPDLHAWYNYNWTTHIVSSKGRTYAVRGASGDTYLLTFVSYYCDDRSSGCVTFQYQEVPAD